jgi:hypothetical protein
MADPKLETTIRHEGVRYAKGDSEAVEALQAVASQELLDSLKKRKLISGTWKSTAKKAPPATETGQLPAGFPSRQLLVKAGYDTVAKVDAAADEDLLKAVGSPEALKAIRDRT